MSDKKIGVRMTPQGKAYLAWAEANDGWSEKAGEAFGAGWRAALSQPLADNANLRAENERLRAAVLHLTDAAHRYSEYDQATCHGCITALDLVFGRTKRA